MPPVPICANCPHLCHLSPSMPTVPIYANCPHLSTCARLCLRFPRLPHFPQGPHEEDAGNCVAAGHACRACKRVGSSPRPHVALPAGGMHGMLPPPLPHRPFTAHCNTAHSIRHASTSSMHPEGLSVTFPPFQVSIPAAARVTAYPLFPILPPPPCPSPALDTS
eukprot:364795-Chlamydomonas_euryale.AAC.23